MKRLSVVLLVALVIGSLAQSTTQAQVADTDWLQLLNTYRAIGGVSPTKEDPVLSEASLRHAFYDLFNGELSVDEDPSKRGYTPEGDKAAPVSIQVGVNDASFSDVHFVETWLATAFYGPLMLNPEMLYVGFGAARDAQFSPIRAAAVMDVNRGATEDNSYARYPVPFPGDGSTVPLTAAFSAEQPDPLTSCPGYSRPAGQPISLQLKKVERVLEYSLLQNGASVEACAFDAKSYVNPNPTAQAIGRSFLDDRRAIVVMPRQVLLKGSTYTVSITTESGTYEWSFAVGDTAIPSPNTVTGGGGADDLSGSADTDVMFGADGSDAIAGADGDDALYGGEGSDNLTGQADNDLVSGGIGVDELNGGAGNDTVNGGDGADKLIGGPGKNKLIGGKGTDTCITSSRKDILVSCEKVRRKRAH